MPQAPDLFVVCKNCGSEVSSYVTECPYCGTRLRKRAPKLEGTDLGDRRRPARPRAPRLGKLRAGEIPGIRPDASHRPIATIVLATACALGAISMAVFSPSQVGVGTIDPVWWHVAIAPFFFQNLWYAAAVIVTILIFGGLLEQRHGPVVVVLLFCVCGMGGIAVAAAVDSEAFQLGANGAALGFLAAWAVRPALELRRGGEPDVDLIGAGVIALVILLMPFVAPEASPEAGTTGLILGLLAGVPLARR